MPLQIPKIDDRKYQDLVDEALARISVHNPEYTNVSRSDPGVTLIELFAFMTESLLYRANLIPERNRLKFLQLLGIPLKSASSARGIVYFFNEKAGNKTITLASDVEVSAEQVPFRTERGLDILPIESKVFYKKPTESQTEVLDYYGQLYASFQGTALDTNVELSLYQTTLLDETDETGVTLAENTIDNSLWVALLARENEDPSQVRKEIASKTLSLGIVPALDRATAMLKAGGQTANPENQSWLSYKLPKVPADRRLPDNPTLRIPEYKPLEARSDADVLTEPGVIELTLPTEDELYLWEDLEPLEMGADDFPPNLEDTDLNERLITWLRIEATGNATKSRFLWVGANASTITQKAKVIDEVLPDGNGEPDQIMKISQSPVLPKSVSLSVTIGDKTEQWEETDDLLSAGAEVVAPDLRLAPGTKPALQKNPKVFLVNTESNEIRFGDGIHGMRPPIDAKISVSYNVGAGILGNVSAGAIDSGATLPAGVKVTNPIRTWGGADSENVVDGERQITRYLQHRERLVTVADFETIVLRTPGVLFGRVEVIPTFNPELSPNEPGDAPGAVTVMVIPRYDAKQPDAPLPDKLFLDTICRHIDERRLITTEVFLRGPVYKQIWLSVGINVVAEKSVAEVRENVKKALLEYLAPINEEIADSLTEYVGEAGIGSEQSLEVNKGWRLRKPVTARELLAVASRVSGVMYVNDVLLAEGIKDKEDQVAMSGLELPRVMGISVTVGEPLSLTQLRGTSNSGSGSGSGGTKKRKVVAIPIIPEEC